MTNQEKCVTILKLLAEKAHKLHWESTGFLLCASLGHTKHNTNLLGHTIGFDQQATVYLDEDESRANHLGLNTQDTLELRKQALKAARDAHHNQNQKSIDDAIDSLSNL